MEGIIDLSAIQVALAYVFVLFVLVIVKIRGISREKEIIISSIRMTLQLILTGYVLVYVFDNKNPFITILIIIIMESFAIYTVYKKFKGKLSSKLKKVIALAMSLGTLTCLAYFLFVVIRLPEWYDPRYFIPLAGMIIGNSMTGISLGINSLLDGMIARKSIIEEALILGATPQLASKNVINKAFDAAILPTINSMLGMGIVFLPGMMTGQILAGVVPTTAITYQIAIMLGIFGSVSLSVIILLQLGYKTFFNKENQLS
ncbi:iron export ABC transporter permease subunit FetB [Vallitalea longa]|uniref:Iron export ABC transporter permease subunit FetB n=1 Tax=Vallitalea longa TaxID=2936439 RepID=A0A9W5Y9M5_9FIRM|nr:iron export ABC transporter permease subunit FetB [Vallitalea longa]GKX29845.1 iron export ABC transporter permease subunit FetB [Vallitalea longa]